MTEGPPAAGRVLVALSCDPDPEVRSTALVVLAEEEAVDNARVRDILAAALTDANRSNQVSAASGLILRGDPRGAEPFARLFATARLDSPEPLILDSAHRLLEYRGSRTGCP